MRLPPVVEELELHGVGQRRRASRASSPHDSVSVDRVPRRAAHAFRSTARRQYAMIAGRSSAGLAAVSARSALASSSASVAGSGSFPLRQIARRASLAIVRARRLICGHRPPARSTPDDVADDTAASSRAVSIQARRAAAGWSADASIKRRQTLGRAPSARRRGCRCRRSRRSADAAAPASSCRTSSGSVPRTARAPRASSASGRDASISVVVVRYPRSCAASVDSSPMPMLVGDVRVASCGSAPVSW